MDTEQAERFVAAAERDYLAMVRVYDALVTRPLGLGVHEVREARADMLAAHAVLLLAREERRLAARRAGERAALERLPIGESGQWLERGDEAGGGGAMTHRPLMPRLDLRRFRWHRSYRHDGTCFVRDGLEDQIVAEGLRQRTASALCAALEGRALGADPVDEEWVQDWLKAHQTEARGRGR